MSGIEGWRVFLKEPDWDKASSEPDFGKQVEIARKMFAHTEDPFFINFAGDAVQKNMVESTEENERSLREFAQSPNLDTKAEIIVELRRAAYGMLGDFVTIASSDEYGIQVSGVAFSPSSEESRIPLSPKQ